MQNTKKTSPKDVFGHLLVIIGLYISVIAFGNLLFGLINIYLPDVQSYNYGRQAESLKWPLALLVIVFPLYAWLTSHLQKDIDKNPEKRELKTRKWLLYFTLFITAIVIVGDLVTLVFRFLNGDLTTQFLLKVFVVLLIAFSVFTYYLWNIRSKISATRHPKMRWFVRGIIAFTAAAIVLGFFASGSPFAARIKKIDDKRVRNLQTLQREIVNYWQAKDALPQTLDDLKDSISGFVPPKDPETNEPYGYNVLGDLEFELCANFKSSNFKSSNKSVSLQVIERPVPIPREAFYPAYNGAYNESWLHKIGRTCFTRDIDPDLYSRSILPKR